MIWWTVITFIVSIPCAQHLVFKRKLVSCLLDCLSNYWSWACLMRSSGIGEIYGKWAPCGWKPRRKCHKINKDVKYLFVGVVVEICVFQLLTILISCVVYSNELTLWWGIFIKSIGFFCIRWFNFWLLSGMNTIFGVKIVSIVIIWCLFAGVA